MSNSAPATMEDITRGQYAKILARARLARAWREEYTEKFRETTLFQAELLEDIPGVRLSWFCYRIVRAVVEALFEVDISSVFEATEDIYANGNCETVDIQLIKERFKANSPATLTLEEQWEILSSTLHTGTSATGPSEPAPELQPPGHLPATLADFNAMTVHEIQQYRYDIPDGVDYARDIAPLARRLHEHTEFFRFGHASIFGIRAYREGPKSGLEFASMALDADMRAFEAIDKREAGALIGWILPVCVQHFLLYYLTSQRLHGPRRGGQAECSAPSEHLQDAEVSRRGVGVTPCHQWLSACCRAEAWGETGGIKANSGTGTGTH
ncbi:hypothetical protein BJ166DRAFT_611662 [Pestalotiopsis sp. NC0098]|nr:hypothetical protein BJ166DRAFT_611662 [Pestalotiopsis sp. NC0098]